MNLDNTPLCNMYTFLIDFHAIGCNDMQIPNPFWESYAFVLAIVSALKWLMLKAHTMVKDSPLCDCSVLMIRARLSSFTKYSVYGVSMSFKDKPEQDYMHVKDYMQCFHSSHRLIQTRLYTPQISKGKWKPNHEIEA